MMQSNLIKPTLIAFVFILTGCNAYMDSYNGAGGILNDYMSFRDYGDVVKRANIYCSSIKKGAPNISKISTGCQFCSSEYDKYRFTCEENPYSQPVSYSQPISSPQNNYRESCSTDNDCAAGYSCRTKPNDAGNECRAIENYDSSTSTKSKAVRIEPIKNSSVVDLEQYKTQCKQLGFKVGTPDFGNCVLELNDAK